MITFALILAIATGDTWVADSYCPTSSGPAEPGEPCPLPGPFVVFFEPGRAEIGPREMRILDNLLELYGPVGQPFVAISGHADRSGPDAYNLALSRRRAEAVVRYLDGRLPVGRIRIGWFGEGRPAVRTPDGVAEPRNRRVDILLETTPDP